MQEKDLPAGRIERRVVEQYSPADTPIRVIGAALCSCGFNTATVMVNRGAWLALGLRVLRRRAHAHAVLSDGPEQPPA